jgi:hypothetical protein
MPWSKLIKAHLGALVGMDFFTVEVATWFGLVPGLCGTTRYL